MEKKLGQKARDMVTGITGILTARTENLNGCVRWCIQPQVPENEPHKVMDHVEWADDQQIEILGDGVRTTMGMDQAEASPVRAATGGPQKADAPRL